MKNPERAWTWLVLTALLFSSVGCGGAPRSNYYTVALEFPSASSATLPSSQVGVDLPRAAHLLRQDRIVYFNHENQLNYYQYHRWAEPPVFLVQSLLIRQLRASGLFDEIVPFRAQKGLDYVLRGRLLAMEEVDRPNDVVARFVLELELVREQDSHVVWTGRAERERPIGEKSVPALVATMSQCVEESLNELTDSLAGAVHDLPPTAAQKQGEP